MIREWLRLYLVTDAPERYAGQFFASIEAALDGGVTLVQYRAESGSRRHLHETACQLAAMLRPRGIPFIVNNHLDLALAIEGAGLHLGQDDLPVAVARKLLGPERLLGLSITCRADLDHAVAEGNLAIVDYLGIGPIFPTGSKADAAPAMGLEGMRDILAATDLPSVAIGGIDASNAASVRTAGADGIAIVSALSRASDPQAAARELLAATG